MSNQKAYSRIHLSTDPFPESERLQTWQDLYSSAFHPCEITTPAGGPLRASATFHIFPGMVVASASLSAHQGRMTRSHVENIGDIVTIIGKKTDSGTLFCAGRAELSPRIGDFLIHRANVPCKFTNTETGDYVGASFSARTLEQLAPGFRLNEARLLKPTPYLGYFMDYIRLPETQPWLPDDLAHTVAGHLKDLIALALGSTRDIEHEARGRGLMAARLKAAKDYIRRNLLDPGLSDQAAARHLGVSPRYIRKLFTMEGSGGVSRYVTEQRLEFAHHQLTHSASPGVKIIDVALHCGFNDVTTFNRLFNARFGMTPSEARSEARTAS
jgi:AraC-like DNA-binding protein